MKYWRNIITESRVRTSVMPCLQEAGGGRRVCRRAVILRERTPVTIVNRKRLRATEGSLSGRAGPGPSVDAVTSDAAEHIAAAGLVRPSERFFGRRDGRWCVAARAVARLPQNDSSRRCGRTVRRALRQF